MEKGKTRKMKGKNRYQKVKKTGTLRIKICIQASDNETEEDREGLEKTSGY